MFGRFIAWWIRNAALIAPIAASISALAATGSVYITSRIFLQARKDRRDELVAKRPKFKLVDGKVIASNLRKLDRTIAPHYQPRFSLVNINPNPATSVKFTSQIFRDESPKVESWFIYRPPDDIDQNENFLFHTEAMELEACAVPYYLQIDAEYTDSRTSEKYYQTIYRKFYIDEGKDADLMKLDMIEVEELIAQRKAVDNYSLQLPSRHKT